MAESAKKITAYNAHTAPTTDDKFFMVGASEEYLINYDTLASAILDKLTSKTYTALNNNVISAILANAADISANADDVAGRYKSYTASTDSIDDIYATGVYFIGNSVAGKPLGTTGSGTGGVLIVGGYGTQNENIVKLYIYTSQNTDGRKGIYMQTYAGATGYGWTKIPLNDKIAYTTVLSATTYTDAASALAALDAYATGITGQMRIVGYISTANSNLLGLSNTSHYFDFYVNSANYRLLVARPVNGADIYQLSKQGGTWATTWTSLAGSSLSYNIDRYTSIASGADLNDLTTVGQYRSTSSTITNSLSNCPVTGFGFTLNVFPAGTAQFLCQEIFTPSAITASGTVVSYRRFVNARDSLFGAWQSVETSISANASAIATNTANIATNTSTIATHTSNISTINGTLTNLTGSQSAGVSNANFNSLTTPGAYQIGDLSTMTNGPASSGYGVLEVVKARSYIIQRFTVSGLNMYVRASFNSGSTWNAWKTISAS